MATYRNVSGEHISVPLLDDRVLEPGETFDLDDEVAREFGFSPDIFETLVAPKGSEPKQPAKNATTEAWQAWAVHKGADPESVATKLRDELIAEFGED